MTVESEKSEGASLAYWFGNRSCVHSDWACIVYRDDIITGLVVVFYAFVLIVVPGVIALLHASSSHDSRSG